MSKQSPTQRQWGNSWTHFWMNEAGAEAGASKRPIQKPDLYRRLHAAYFQVSGEQFYKIRSILSHFFFFLLMTPEGYCDSRREAGFCIWRAIFKMSSLVYSRMCSARRAQHLCCLCPRKRVDSSQGRPACVRRGVRVRYSTGVNECVSEQSEWVCTWISMSLFMPKEIFWYWSRTECGVLDRPTFTSSLLSSCEQHTPGWFSTKWCV